ncbi:Uncharacterised protein [Metamycoplasma cloacale]|uniref:SGNH/GDSL hydrolase family protein n=1 Tax=Metamycoplasma cloacale TaxID=92401 RepID=A0A2Z4LMD7_9BACT|nr:SGNH/GDSL hydrolase family protein [Metamycoplasma cloacale]AWX42906.1 SGNH/GDSL hydrolase family protein [Metamycoplasma cloacale]VEU79270.1 Uncharacterised protein [Metamycoplasma cloacale]
MQKEINYVAIGDSISQGFNSKIGGPSFGFKYRDQKFHKGYSYSDYFLEYLYHYLKKNTLNYNEIFDNISYENLSLATARIEDYINILNGEINDNIIDLFKLNNRINKETRFYKGIYKDFYDIQENVEDLRKTIARDFYIKIKNANLLTCTIGGNEFQASFPLMLLKRIIFEKNYFLQLKIKDQIVQEMKKITEKLKPKFLEFIRKIRDINPNLKIMLISYTPPFLPFILSFESILQKRNPIIFNDLFKNIYQEISLLYEEIGKEYDCEIIKPFKFKYWLKNSNLLVENTIDVHPTELGYQQIGRLIFNRFLEKGWFGYNKTKQCKIYYSNKIKLAQLITEEVQNDFDLSLKMNFNVNKISIIFNAWTHQNNQLQNPYFVLLKRETNRLIDHELKNVEIVKRNEYLSLSELLLENMFFIFKYLDVNSKIKEFIEDNVKNDYLLTILKNIIRSENIQKIIFDIEEQYRKLGCIKLQKFIKLAAIHSETHTINLFNELYHNPNSKLKEKIDDFLDAVIHDLENNVKLQQENHIIKEFIDILVSDLSNRNHLINLIKQFKLFLGTIYNYSKVDEIYYQFLSENKIEIKQTYLDIINGILQKYENNDVDFSEMLLTILNVKKSLLNWKDWRKLECIIKNLYSSLKDDKFKESLFNIIWKSLNLIRLWDWIQFDKFSIMKFYIQVIKKFGMLITRNLMNPKLNKLKKIIFKISSFVFRMKIKKKIKG